MVFPGFPKLPTKASNIYSFPSDTIVPIVLSQDEADLIINPRYIFERNIFGDLIRLWIVGYSIVHKQEVRYYKEYYYDNFGNLVGISEWKKP